MALALGSLRFRAIVGSQGHGRTSGKDGHRRWSVGGEDFFGRARSLGAGQDGVWKLVEAIQVAGRAVPFSGPFIPRRRRAARRELVGAVASTAAAVWADV